MQTLFPSFNVICCLLVVNFHPATTQIADFLRPFLYDTTVLFPTTVGSDWRPQYTLPFLFNYLNLGSNYQATTVATSTSTFTIICTVSVSKRCPRQLHAYRRQDFLFEGAEVEQQDDAIVPSTVFKIEPTMSVIDVDSLVPEKRLTNSEQYWSFGGHRSAPYEIQSTFVAVTGHSPYGRPYPALWYLAKEPPAPAMAHPFEVPVFPTARIGNVYGTYTRTTSTFTTITSISVPPCYDPQGPWPQCPFNYSF